VRNVDVIDPVADPGGFEALLVDRLGKKELSVIVTRRPCILAAADIRGWDKQNALKLTAGCSVCAEGA
jgi:indolepyruvate ferredoxin oxidoreductase alpha subunit